MYGDKVGLLLKLYTISGLLSSVYPVFVTVKWLSHGKTRNSRITQIRDNNVTEPLSTAGAAGKGAYF